MVRGASALGRGGAVMGGDLTLHESADLLGVHYMTVYRYVRLGLLRADKVKGTWRVRSSDLQSFQQPVAAAPEAGTRRRAPWAERLESRLVAGDAQGSWGVIEAALASGAKLDDIYLDLLVSALQSIGRRYRSGELDVSVERRASVIAFRLIGRLGPRFTRRGRNKGVVIVGAAAGETSGIGIAIAADILRQRGWDVSDLGPDVPAAGFTHMVLSTESVVAVGLLAQTVHHLTSTAATISAIRAASPSVLIVVGGDAVPHQDHAVSVGADHWVADPRQFAELLDLTVTSTPPST